MMNKKFDIKKEEIDIKKRRFERYYADLQKTNPSFSTLIGELLKNESAMSFQSATGLSENLLSRLRNRTDAANPPSMVTLVSVGVGYKWGLLTVQTLLHSLGIDFNKRKRSHVGYAYVLSMSDDNLDIQKANQILTALGCAEKELLGSRERKSKMDKYM